jgi:hypothetical protein
VLEYAINRQLPGPAATERLAAELALVPRGGSVILLAGEVGSGKSTFARAFIRSLAANPELEVPSPTFTLVQPYENLRLPVLHADLYRLSSMDEVAELGLDEAAVDGIVIVEWPDRLGGSLSPDTLHVELSGTGASRQAVLRGTGAYAEVLRRLDEIAAFLTTTPFATAVRSFLEGDASFRRYERLEKAGRRWILMDMPKRPDGPPVRDGKPYSQIAHLAEDIRAVIAVNEELRQRGLSAPETLACDFDKGLAVIEDLGDNVFGRLMREGRDMRLPMSLAVELLAEMARQDWPATAELRGQLPHRIAPYDREAMEIEISLLADWFWPLRRAEPMPAEVRAGLLDIWQPLLDRVLAGPRVWTLRDFHSPNLIWLPNRRGTARVGLIDTQDCVLGHPAYDVASLLQDARVDIPFAMADQLLDHYCDLLRRSADFDETEFRVALAVLGAQRATKILGIFARLSRRDGKSGYLQHIPRVSRYLERNLSHPALARLKAWFDRHLPLDLREAALP